MKRFIVTLPVFLNLLPWNAVLGMALAPTATPAVTPTPDLSGDNSDEWLPMRDDKGRAVKVPVVNLRGKRVRPLNEFGWNAYRFRGNNPNYFVNEWVFRNKNLREDLEVYIKDDDGVALLWNDAKRGIYRYDRKKNRVQVIIDYIARGLVERIGFPGYVTYDNTKTYFAFYGSRNDVPCIVFNSQGEIMWERKTARGLTWRGKKGFCVDGIYPSSKGDAIVWVGKCDVYEGSSSICQIWDRNGNKVAELPLVRYGSPYWFPDGEKLEYQWKVYDKASDKRIKRRAIFDRRGNWLSGDKPVGE